MRTKDEFKKDAVIQATVKLVNEIGFVASSVSKIAKEAGVSPATIYVYYKNKEDLLVSTYINIKQMIGQKTCQDIDQSQPLRDILKNVWQSMFKFVDKYPDYFHFTEQFANSPYADLVNKEEIEKAFAPIYSIVQKGIEQKIIKDVSMDILSAFMFFPIITLANKRLCQSFTQGEKDIETAFTLAWDAIKL